MFQRHKEYNLPHQKIKFMPEDFNTTTPGGQTISASSIEPEANSQIIHSLVEKNNLAEVREEEIIKLLEERLVVNLNQQKIGDVIVRKVIETRMVQVPVRREKLIVEQISPENKQLAEIDLGSGEISGVELTQGERAEFVSLDGGLAVSGVFSSPKIASLLLNAIALEQNHSCQQVQVSIVVEDQEHQQKYQEWFDRCSQR
ncbi:DUF2382 domain-containing protein [Calothrix sp. PCC 7507]|uniref:DUF2382 domain-containing protein n=1 Tax=Calothrix sp. PCC 7507 TaxID=99598 RepID=UPI00029F35E7|nr:DUF2382 domain-containing protein [Calothrix sp. PCC 7507]AFY32880.1 protein of unknown function DUF2382-containing protein [Calothrix sp. PCC 7507]